MKYIYSEQDQNIINKIKSAIEKRKQELIAMTGFQFAHFEDGVLEYYQRHLADFEKRATPSDVNTDIPDSFVEKCNQTMINQGVI